MDLLLSSCSLTLRFKPQLWKYHVNLRHMGGTYIKTIRTNNLEDIHEACRAIYPYFNDLGKIPEYTSCDVEVTKQHWLRHAKLQKTLEGHTHAVSCVAFHGDYIVSGSYDKTLKVWDQQTGKCIRTLEGHKHAVYCVASHGDYIVSGSFDSTLKIWG